MQPDLRLLTFTAAALFLLVAPAFAQTKLSPQVEISLLPDYKHAPLQGIDSIVGKLEKKDGPTVSYEIGGVTPPGGLRVGGSFSNAAAGYPKEMTAWQKTQKINGRSLHVVYTKDETLIVSTEIGKSGINLSAPAKSAEEIAEILLMAASLSEAKAK